MPNGVRDMGFSTAINLFLLNGMPSFPLPPNPDIGCVMFDDYRNMWIVFNGKEWVDVDLREHKCELSVEEIMFGKKLNEESIQD